MKNDTLDEKRLLNTFSELVSIDSLSFSERAMADRLISLFSEEGVTLEEDNTAQRIGGNTGNLYGFLSAQGEDNGQTILFAAHMDTVSPGIGKHAVLHEDGMITSDGTTVLGADDAAAISCILEALREVREENLPHPALEFLFTSAEEAYVRGASAFDYEKLRADCAYVPDLSAGCGSYASSEPTLITFTVKIRGKSAHAGFEPESGISAISVAADAVQTIPVGCVGDGITCNIGTIEGGTAPNIIPEHVLIRGEIRSARHEQAVRLLDEVFGTFRKSADRAGASIETAYDVCLTAYQVRPEELSVKRYRRVLERLGITARPVPTFGGSDNNVLRRNGISGINIANSMHRIHTTDEYTSVAELATNTKILKGLMTESGEL